MMCESAIKEGRTEKKEKKCLSTSLAAIRPQTTMTCTFRRDVQSRRFMLSLVFPPKLQRGKLCDFGGKLRDRVCL